MKSFPAFLIAVFMFVAPAQAQRVFPLACDPGKTCWIIGYPDLNEKKGVAQDYACGPGAEDGDVFLHIGLPDVAFMTMNPAVHAVDAGVVTDAQDGLDDLVADSRAALSKETPNCGNGVIIKHAGGVQSAYCHLRKGSVQVKAGDRVEANAIIGTAGQSGVALWPQLAFSLHEGGFFIDPLTGATVAEGCGMPVAPEVDVPLQLLDYQPAAITALGFSIAPVDAKMIALGRAPRFSTIKNEEPHINMWGMILGVRKGDAVEIAIHDPRGRVFYRETFKAEEDTPRIPVNAGRTRGYIGWRKGAYVGSVTITRSVKAKPYTVSRLVRVTVE